jgi:outer membrane protein assembly factor BamA
MKIQLYKSATTIIFLAFFGLYAMGQGPLSTDRPDATEGSHVMSQGVLQLELGYNTSSEEFGEGSIDVNSFGGLARFGLFENFEIRLVIGSTKMDYGIGFTESSGLDPISLGFKTKLIEEGKFIPNISFLGSLTLSGTGDESYELNNTAPGFRFILDKELSDVFGLGVNLGMEWNGFDSRPTSISTVVLGVGLTDELGAFFELESYYLKNAPDAHIFNLGFTVWLLNNIQLDFGYGIGISDNDFENQMTIGASVRLFK